jgi:ABC-type lipoprotein release transport system permease subunit
MSLNNIKDIAIISSGYLTESNVKIANNTIPSNSEILVTYSNNINKLSNMTESIDIDIDKWKNLNNNEVIVNTYYKNKYKLKKNDLITISYTKNEKHFSYDVALDLKIIDFANTNAFDEGAIIVTEETANKLVKTEYQDLFVNLIDNKKSKETAKSIEKLLVSEERVKTKKEYNDYITQNIKIEKILIYIIIAAIVGVGLIGIINNQSVAFIERSKEMAILYSTCMSRKQLSQMVFKELLYSYIISSVCSLIYSFVLVQIVSNLSYNLGSGYVEYLYLYSLLLLFILSIIMFKIYRFSKKRIYSLNIVNEIKYE